MRYQSQGGGGRARSNAAQLAGVRSSSRNGAHRRSSHSIPQHGMSHRGGQDGGFFASAWQPHFVPVSGWGCISSAAINQRATFEEWPLGLALTVTCRRPCQLQPWQQKRKERQKMEQLDPPRVVAVVVVGGGARDGANTDNLL